MSFHDRNSSYVNAPRSRVVSSRVGEKQSPSGASPLETENMMKAPVKESTSAGNRGERPKRASLPANANVRKKQKEPPVECK